MRHAKRLLTIIALVTIATGAIAEPRGPIDREPVIRRVVRIIKRLLPTPHDQSEMSPPHP
jgi:hypothetical protein